MESNALLRSLRLLLCLGWLLAVSGISFVPGAHGQRPSSAEPSRRKLFVWLLLFLASFSALWLVPALRKGG